MISLRRGRRRHPVWPGDRPPRVGLPAALLAYKYAPLWRGFLEALPCEVVVSPPTTKAILFQGVRTTVDDLCIPVKAFIGHCLHLRDAGVDALLVPRVISVERSAKARFSCPKFIGLPDMTRALLGEPPLILDVDHHLRERSLESTFLELGARLGFGRRTARAAFAVAEAQQSAFAAAVAAGEDFHAAAGLRGGRRGPGAAAPAAAGGPAIGLVAHEYLVFDDFLSVGLSRRLAGLGARVELCTQVPAAAIEAELAGIGEVSWSYERQLLGAVGHFLGRKDVDGIVFLTSFACGTFAVVSELIERELRQGRRKPILYLTVDELTGEAGLQTRLESFCDMLAARVSS
ncbi:hypothetical protein FJ251_12470 [bacterium]|nr:hypothetical protein [bacterium]